MVASIVQVSGLNFNVCTNGLVRIKLRGDEERGVIALFETVKGVTIR